jgi:RNA polymerase primary sigma factor
MYDDLDVFLAEASKTPLLTHQQECELGTQVQAGIAAQQRLNHGEPDPCGELARLVEAGLAAREHLLQANLLLVAKVALKHKARGSLTNMDLFQEGCTGLLRAIDKFDPAKGTRFSTYATWWIRQAVGRAISDSSRTIRIPVHLLELGPKMVRAAEALRQRHGREPSAAEIAEEAGLSLQKVELSLRSLERQPASLDVPLGGGLDDVTLGETIAADDQDMARGAYLDELRRNIEKVLSRLEPRARKVIEMRFGLDGGGGATLEAVGQTLGITRERARQIQAESIRVMQHPHFGRELVGFLED